MKLELTNSFRPVVILLTILSTLSGCSGDDHTTPSNITPTISDQTFWVSEEASTGTFIGTIVASNENGSILTYSITDGNKDDIFSIESSSGALSLAGKLDFETVNSYALTVQVDNGESTADATITVTVINEVEPLFCTDNDRFSEIDYFQDGEIDVITDIAYAQANNFEGVLETLLLDIYMPKLSEDPLEKRPFVLQMFGGGFVAGNKTMMREDCMTLTRKGFVCASINYRLGDVDGGRAIYRAQQDAHAAMRWIVANSETYGIDTTWFFAGGQSAGGVVAGYLNYSSQDDWNAAAPTLESDLGSLVTSGNDLSTTFKLKGLVMNWANVRIDDVSPAEMIPVIAFHGEDDPVVPIDDTPFGAGGSRWLHNELVANSICSDLTVAPGAGHSPPVLIDPEFRMSKASCFFKSLFCESCNTVYVEENIEASCSSN